MVGLFKTNYVLFTTIQYHFSIGVPSEQQDQKVYDLNIAYSSMRARGESQTNALYSLVKNNPYRVLSLKSKKVFFMKTLHGIFNTYNFI